MRGEDPVSRACVFSEPAVISLVCGEGLGAPASGGAKELGVDCLQELIDRPVEHLGLESQFRGRFRLGAVIHHLDQARQDGGERVPPLAGVK
jgi:hypothetical protein